MLGASIGYLFFLYRRFGHRRLPEWPLPHGHLRTENKKDSIKNKRRQRKSVGPIKSQRHKNQHRRDSHDEKQSGIEYIEENQERRPHTDHPEKLSPGERSGYLVFDIDKLRDTEHHICLQRNRELRIENKKIPSTPTYYSMPLLIS